MEECKDCLDKAKVQLELKHLRRNVIEHFEQLDNYLLILEFINDMEEELTL